MTSRVEFDDDWVNMMNKFGDHKIPFIFILDFELKKPLILKIDQLPSNIYYKFNNIKNYTLKGSKSPSSYFYKKPIEFELFEEKFDRVKAELLFGNSFLLNLTFPTEIQTDYCLKDMFDIAHAKYKLFFNDQFIVFSPETFIQIKSGKIFTFPMKGTIDASIPNASEILISDEKELAEHFTIVDLLRNDVSLVSKKVKVEKFRYLEKIQTNSKTLFQTSSRIVGQLQDDYTSNLGNIMSKLLPAGSISGAPKKKTIDIIRANEMGDRGYYTGVFGIFDGKNVDSGVMIRFIEKDHDRLIYRSGCGITNLSTSVSEYNEMIDKVYVPINRKH